MGSDVLFKVPIAKGGDFECTLVGEKVYLLAFSSPPDNRLTSGFIDAFMLALDILEHKHPHGALITTSKIAKFYSNGLDLEEAVQTQGFFPNRLWPLFKRVLTYPMPTIALLNGHAFAGGLMLAMHHDYRVMNPAKGFLCLNEMLFGAVMAAPMISIFRIKLAPTTFRALVLEAHRFGGREALDERLVDGLGGLDETLGLIGQRQLTKMSESGAYRPSKEEMYRESLYHLTHHDDDKAWRAALDAVNATEKEQQVKRVAASRSASNL